MVESISLVKRWDAFGVETEGGLLLCLRNIEVPEIYTWYRPTNEGFTLLSDEDTEKVEELFQAKVNE